MVFCQACHSGHVGLFCCSWSIKVVSYLLACSEPTSFYSSDRMASIKNSGLVKDFRGTFPRKSNDDGLRIKHFLPQTRYGQGRATTWTCYGQFTSKQSTTYLYLKILIWRCHIPISCMGFAAMKTFTLRRILSDSNAALVMLFWRSWAPQGPLEGWAGPVRVQWLSQDRGNLGRSLSCPKGCEY